MGKTRSRTKCAETLRQMYLWVEEKRARILPAGKISREAMRLQTHGVRCWFAPHDMKPGTVMTREIDRAIYIQDKVLLLLSTDAIRSGWVDREVDLALAREREQQREILFPVRLDEAVMQSTAGWVATLRRTRHIGDFTHWLDPAQYQIAFERVLRDLKQN